MTRTRLVAAALLMVVLAACGGSSSANERPTALALAAKLRAGGVPCDATIVSASERELFAREEGECQIEGNTLSILIYNSNDSRDHAIKVGKGFGGIYVVGDRWAVSSPDDAMAERVRAVLGGRVT